MGLAEVAGAAAATQTHGWIQALFAIYFVMFSCGVGGAFFFFLRNNPLVLYPPSAYTEHATITQFAELVHSNTERSQKMRKRIARASAEHSVRLLHGESAKAETVVEKAIEAAEVELREAGIIVDLSAFRASAGDSDATTFFPIGQETTVAQLLSHVYAEIQPHVKPYTYGLSWVLDDANGNRLKDMGSRWARRHTGAKFDHRRLNDVGVNAGARLAVRSLP
ncbi:hypothetical protein [Streptomyces sp. RKCA744]|uniref:hypothetical protein n=1 Tax=Streptomyces sp. RKCA744 TaxID=2959340 RepID=UPI00209EC29A|nr:hypothetical protein [Streptomyces sp. RKCA744]MCO8305918.1 hypothetical protein [Streptomyces sp. RKCA744]